jgi:hypothetical protein
MPGLKEGRLIDTVLQNIRNINYACYHNNLTKTDSKSHTHASHDILVRRAFVLYMTYNLYNIR